MRRVIWSSGRAGSLPRAPGRRRPPRRDLRGTRDHRRQGHLPATDPGAAAALAAGAGRAALDRDYDLAGPCRLLPAGRPASGDPVRVPRADGGWLGFEVTATARYPKDRFPTEAVFGPVTGPVVRLVTCTGTSDRASGHYLDNLVVTARPAG